MITTAIFPARYVQGPGALDELGNELSRLGTRALLLQDTFVAEHLQAQLKISLSGKLFTHQETFQGECCDEEIDRLAVLAKQQNVNVVAGLGGGKALDTAKAVACQLHAPVAIVPTIASTDAPCSALSVIYTQSGEFKRYLILPKNPELILVDSSVVVNAPARLFVSGMGDALATWFEAESCQQSGASNLSGRPGPMTAYALAKLCFDTLMEYGVQAKVACEAHVSTQALENVIEANTLLSGLGFESGGLSAAHSIHNGLTVLPQTHQFWHGEKVAFGTLCMLTLSHQKPALIDLVFDFCETVGLPTTLEAIGLAEVTDSELWQVAETACAPGEIIHNAAKPVTSGSVFAAIKATDAYGRYRQQS